MLIRKHHALTICDSYIFVGNLTVNSWPETGPGIGCRAHQHGRDGFAAVSSVLVDFLAGRVHTVEIVVTTVLFSLVTAALQTDQQVAKISGSRGPDDKGEFISIERFNV